MKAEPQRACPNCGNELSGAMEFCPVCMLRKGLAGGVESGESSFEETLKLTPEQTAQRFEHYELVTGDDGKPVELSAVESKPASWGRIKTSHFFPINRSKMFWQEADLRFFEQWR
jgi:hypothetical protein